MSSDSRLVWKYLIQGPEFDVDIPVDAQLLHAGLDPATGHISLWFLVVPSRARETRRFSVYPTGTDVPWGKKHLGTVQRGPYMWHIFEDKSNAN